MQCEVRDIVQDLIASNEICGIISPFLHRTHDTDTVYNMHIHAGLSLITFRPHFHLNPYAQHVPSLDVTRKTMCTN